MRLYPLGLVACAMVAESAIFNDAQLVFETLPAFDVVAYMLW